MKGCVLHKAGDLRVQDRPVVELGSDEVRVDIAVGGICGSDLHYYFDGRVGDFEVLEPLTLGHEVSGRVAEIGPAVSRVRPGQHVAINPGLACQRCDYCRTGRENLCRHMVFYGSAAVRPHVQGAFQQQLAVRERQLVPIPESLDLGVAAMAEPLSVALHAINRAGSLLGKRVMIAGCGPIGALVALVARRAGATEIIATDVQAAQLDIVRELGVDETIDVAGEPDAIARLAEGKGTVDVAFEVSGAPAAIATLFDCTRPGGRMVQVGFLPPGEVGVPVNRLMSKEIDYVGSFRFREEFDWAVRYLAGGLIDVTPLLSARFAMSDAPAAFEAAARRDGTMKVQLEFC